MAGIKNISGRVLPKPEERNILITAALPYVNNVPHLGNLIGSVLSADVFARYCRGCGVNALFICGTDEYGMTSEVRARIENCTPKELCDKYHIIHAAVYKWFNIDFDIFGRTTTGLQTEITQNIFRKLNENGYLEERETIQLYCQAHNSFLADRFVEGTCPFCGCVDARGDQCDACDQLLDPVQLLNPRCKIDGATPIAKATKHFFLGLDKLQPKIHEFFEGSATKGVWSRNGKEITAAWLNQEGGLKPRSITRDIKWGTKVPVKGYEEKAFYPWFDACIGYVSITAGYTDNWEKWWRNPEKVQLYQFIGKDNVPFHSVVFPATQIGTQDTWTKLHHLSTTEYLTYEGGKFSKGRSVGVFGDSAQKTGISSDVWRYYLLSDRPETKDSEFNWDAFIASNNNELVKNLGNFVNRVIKFVNSKHFNNLVPDYETSEYKFENWRDEINTLLAQYNEALDAVKLRAGLAIVLKLSQVGNNFLSSNGLDNKLAVNEPSKCATVIGFAINLIHLLTCLVEPYLPETANSINRQLSVNLLPIPNLWTADTIKPGHKIRQAVHLFSPIKAEKADEWRQQFSSQ